AVVICMLNGLFQTLVLNKDYYEVYWRTDVRASSILISCAVYLWVRRHNYRLLESSMFLLLVGALGILLNINVVPDYVKYSFGTFCFAICVSRVDALPKMIVQLLRAR